MSTWTNPARRVGVALAVATCCLGTLARATPSYPDVIQRHLNLPASVPQTCGLCHVGGVVGVGTVNTPFGVSLRARGAAAFDEPGLRAALDRLQADGTDSDRDGVSDIQELRNRTNPNLPSTDAGRTDGGEEALGPPVYGCGADASSGLLSAGAVALALRSRSQRRRSGARPMPGPR